MSNSLERLSEDQVLKLAQENDSDAIDFLLKKYKSVVRRKARPLYIMGGDRDDLMQEGMIGLFKAIRDYDIGEDASFATFAELCVSRQIYTAIKSSNRRKNMPLNNYISLYAPAYVPEDGEGQDGDFMIDQTTHIREKSPEEIVIGRESTEDMKESLFTGLSKMESEVLRLYLSGLTYQEIAAEMKKEPKAIDNALQRIKNKVSKSK